jgi:site-specific DNA-methyltransferase (adenine-specific)
MAERFLGDRVMLHCGDCREVLAELPENHFDSCCCDPPYHLTSIVKRFANSPRSEATENLAVPYGRHAAGFMGKRWDGGDIAFDPATWSAVYRVLKPGAHLVAFGGTRTYARMAVAIEDAGFEIRDTIAWLYGSGFPKSHDVSKGIDRMAGAEREVVGQRNLHSRGDHKMQDGWRRPWMDDPEAVEQSMMQTAPATDAARQWDGWGTALKPAMELIVLARKPLSEGTVAANVLKWGTGAINVDGCRVGVRERPKITDPKHDGHEHNCYGAPSGGGKLLPDARWPANVAHDGSAEVTAAFPETLPATQGIRDPNGSMGYHGGARGLPDVVSGHIDNGGSAARFFFQAKQDDQSWDDGRQSKNGPARIAGECLSLQSDHVVSVLSNAVAISAGRLSVQKQSYRARDMTVSAMELRLACESVIEAIQNIERRFLLGLPRENVSAKLGPVMCVAIPNQTGITMITLSLMKSDHFVEVATFVITETSLEVGASDCARRFHYTSKADGFDRAGSSHPTVKPLDLMQWLVRLVTPKNGRVLDCFAGTGTTAEAAFREGMSCELIEAEAEYQADIRRRMALVLAGPDERARESVKAKNLPRNDGPLFDWQPVDNGEKYD